MSSFLGNLLGGSLSGQGVYDQSTSTASNNLIWTEWLAADNIGNVGNATYVANQAWIGWNAAREYQMGNQLAANQLATYGQGLGLGQQGQGNYLGNAYAYPAISEEERQRRIDEQRRLTAEFEREREQRRIRILAAEDRATRLLKSCLTEEQITSFEKDRYFEVLSADGARHYRLHREWAGNVRVYDSEGRLIEKLCIHPTKPMPIEDSLLAQKLMLETNEELFRKIANITRIAA